MTANRKRFLGFFITGIGLVLCCVGSWTLLSPPQYRAAARIKLEPNIADVRELYSQNHESAKLDPYFIQTESEVLQSELVLGKVIETLNLKSEWGKKHAGAGPLETSEVIALLKQRMNVHSINNTKLIEVSFSSEDPVWAAKIANAIAEAYVKYRHAESRDLALRDLKALEERFDESEQKVKALREKVESLKHELSVPEGQTNDLGQEEYRPYWQAKRELESAMRFSQILSLKINSEKVDVQLPKCSMVTITDLATLPSSPVRPKWTPLVLGLVMVGLGMSLSTRTR